MGFFSWISDKWENFKEKAKEIWDIIINGTYDPEIIEDQIDVDRALEEFRDKIKEDAQKQEQKCMSEFEELFYELKKKTCERFPDLAELVEKEQGIAKKELQGTIMGYVKENLSKNNDKFADILILDPGVEKERKIKNKTKEILNNAVAEFNTKLSKSVIKIQESFTTRLNERLDIQEKELNAYIEHLEELTKQSETGVLNIQRLIDDCTPVMESAKCIMYKLESEA